VVGQHDDTASQPNTVPRIVSVPEARGNRMAELDVDCRSADRLQCSSVGDGKYND
jgi:hypothetical protein